MFTVIIWVSQMTSFTDLVLCRYCFLCSPSSVTTACSRCDAGSREYWSGSAMAFMGLNSKTEKPCGNQASGQIHPCSKLWHTPGRVRCSSCSYEWLLVSANKCKVMYVSLNECTEKLNQYFWINHRNFSKLDLLFLQCWIKMSNRHNSIIGEKIKQHTEYWQVISNCQCHNYP